jgi:hypothetical protein
MHQAIFAAAAAAAAAVAGAKSFEAPVANNSLVYTANAAILASVAALAAANPQLVSG